MEQEHALEELPLVKGLEFPSSNYLVKFYQDSINVIDLNCQKSIVLTNKNTT